MLPYKIAHKNLKINHICITVLTLQELQDLSGAIVKTNLIKYLNNRNLF